MNRKMSLVVQKFGGTSVSDISKILNIANKVQAEIDNNNQVVLVISAMSGVTSTLLNYCKSITELSDENDLSLADFVLSNGENISAGLVAMALRKNGISAIALQAWQAGIATNNQYSRALITKIDTSSILKYLDAGIVPVISGFQGITSCGKITTLGRGGSDITAAAIAASLQAQRCDIYTDVSGVYSADPRIVPNAYKITEIDYTSMLEFSYAGAKVLHPRSVEIAKEHNLELRVISSFDNIQGTQIKNNQIMEESKILGIAQNKNILLTEISTNSKLSLILEHLRSKNINIFSSNYASDDIISILVPIEDLGKIEHAMAQMLKEKIINSFKINADVALVNVIGTRLLNDLSLLDNILAITQELTILSLQVESMKISILTFQDDAEKIVKQLHAGLMIEQ